MKKLLALFLVFSLLLAVPLYAEETQSGSLEESIEYSYQEYPLERQGIALHLDCLSLAGQEPARHILLIHGVTYSSHEFDLNYQDYSLVRFLAQNGYGVWRLDIAGFGSSGQVEDGFLPDSAYASEDIHAAVDYILSETGAEKIDLLGWSWGTVTTSLYVKNYPDHINRLVLYAPILCGLGEATISEDFHVNTWEHAADDFQRDAEGGYDFSIIDPLLVELYCSNCWHYDQFSSPNGGRRDLCVAATEKLIDLSALTVPTLVICGGNDPYLNYDLVDRVLEDLPAGSALKVIPGGAHMVMVEKPFYHEFQDSLLTYLDQK